MENILDIEEMYVICYEDENTKRILLQFGLFVSFNDCQDYILDNINIKNVRPMSIKFNDSTLVAFNQYNDYVNYNIDKLYYQKDLLKKSLKKSLNLYIRYSLCNNVSGKDIVNSIILELDKTLTELRDSIGNDFVDYLKRLKDSEVN